MSYYKHGPDGAYGVYVDQLPADVFDMGLAAEYGTEQAWYDGDFFYTRDGYGYVQAEVARIWAPKLDAWKDELETVRYVPPPAPPVDQAYPDGNPKSIQGAKKHSLRYSPTAALIHMNAAFADGAAKYGAANWREKGVAGSVYIDAALRHMSLYFDGGEQVASDSKVHHLGHAMACLAIILDAEAAGTLTDDRPTPMPNLEALLKRT